MEYILSQEKLYEIQFDVVLYDQVEEAELDEMWSFVQNKSNQRWLWLAINQDTGDILAYTFGKRKDAVFKAFKKILEPFGITMFYTDDWGSYQRNLESNNHSIGKRNTQTIEKKISHSELEVNADTRNPLRYFLVTSQQLRCYFSGSLNSH